jgi:hypothetical protein
VAERAEYAVRFRVLSDPEGARSLSMIFDKVAPAVVYRDFLATVVNGDGSPVLADVELVGRRVIIEDWVRLAEEEVT